MNIERMESDPQYIIPDHQEENGNVLSQANDFESNYGIEIKSKKSICLVTPTPKSVTKSPKSFRSKFDQLRSPKVYKHPMPM